MNPPNVPYMIVNDLSGNVTRIIGYLQSLEAFLRDGEPDPAWVVTGITADTTLAVGATLPETVAVLGTLINSLKSKGLV